jgi:DNA-binding GntR family transcriptional regulator
MNPKTDLPNIQPPQPLAELAYERLKDSIASGRLDPGEILTENYLAEKLGISRTPTREALLKLSAEGLVTYIPRRGVMINEFNRRDVEEIHELRLALELAVIDTIAQNPSRYDLKGVRRYLKDQARAQKQNDYDAASEANRDFHLELCRLTNNSRMLAILENISIITMAVGARVMQQREGKSAGEHRIILNHIAAGRASAARKAMADHLNRNRDELLRMMDFEPNAAG